ncbi:sulfatase-like hydrolase/transferase [Flammeovirga yaeyamensis]|uniref:Sulfatase-like hydrolase/transferase n=1 Tax=Flammeovirga yaeyamensis TaxID=367791 RepID=A0AAX1N9D2_9BACT|nr:arylsulfatase [Flammeovirga yaeyamensis]MBB3699549.1 arylsulfatase A-like enzyme [Flammeovirga yaeyamensis]NMF35196.1 arylsulfatase [Flammeovirga yaeyamensis]QWG04060.1 sulfatase-like hydrolase/transferase [Flammeovirga yaeyamensis]
MKCNYTIFFYFISSFLFFQSCVKIIEKDDLKRPNIIVVITDDQGYGDMGHTGNSIIKTPAIDSFSKQSINLTNYHVSTTCAPTRSAMMTGRNPNRVGVWHTIMGASMLNGDEQTLPEVLKDAGYKTGMFGKWHLGDNHPFRPHDKGFDRALYHGGGGIGQTPDYWNNNYFDDTYFRNEEPEKHEGYCTDVWFEEAIKFIENSKDEPFFTYISLNAPHGPYNVPKEYYDLYADETELLESQKRFYGMITNIDDNFKTLLDKLDELKISDNTIVLFTTDNGTANGFKKDPKTKKVYGYNAGMRGTKASHYDGGHRVPMIIRWPNGALDGGKTLSELTSHVDLLPTLTSLAKVPFTPKKELDGVDISQYLQNENKPEERMIIVDTQRLSWPKKGKQSCVMQGDWRLIDGKDLYNLKTDPGQENNIADQHQERVEKMNAFYTTWWDKMIQETKYSVIDLGIDKVDVITCHDAHTDDDNYPPWNQKLIRDGKLMKPAKFLVNFTKKGKYKIGLSRWPEESGLLLNAELNDDYPKTKYVDARVKGKSLEFEKAFIKIGNKVSEASVDNTLTSTDITVDVEEGQTDLTAWFTTKDGEETNAFYLYVSKVEEESLM